MAVVRDPTVSSEVRNVVNSLSTLASELHTDHSTSKTTVDALVTLATELRTDHATFKSAADDTKTVLGDMCMSAAGLAIGVGSKAKVLIANTVNFLIDGVFKSKTTAELDFTATTHDIPDGDEQVYTISLQANGTATLTPGGTSTGAGTAAIPNGPAGECVIGHVRIFASGAIFDATTDLLDAGHLTVTYTDVAFLPARITPAPATITAAAPAAGPAALAASAPDSLDN